MQRKNDFLINWYSFINTFLSIFSRPKKFNLNESLIKKDLGKDYVSYLKIKQFFKGRQIDKKRITFYYPGSGCDMLSMFVIYNALVSEKNKYAKFVFLDFRDMFDAVIFQIKKYSPNAKIRYLKYENKYHINVIYQDKIFDIVYYVKDASSFFPSELKNNIDIYYERAFEIFRANDSGMMYKIYSNIKPLGLIMTDHSFDFGAMKGNFVKLKKIPKNFGLYKNFQIWQKLKM